MPIHLFWISKRGEESVDPIRDRSIISMVNATGYGWNATHQNKLPGLREGQKIRVDIA